MKLSDFVPGPRKVALLKESMISCYCRLRNDAYASVNYLSLDEKEQLEVMLQKEEKICRITSGIFFWMCELPSRFMAVVALIAVIIASGYRLMFLLGFLSMIAGPFFGHLFRKRLRFIRLALASLAT